MLRVVRLKLGILTSSKSIASTRGTFWQTTTPAKLFCFPKPQNNLVPTRNALGRQTAFITSPFLRYQCYVFEDLHRETVSLLRVLVQSTPVTSLYRSQTRCITYDAALITRLTGIRTYKNHNGNTATGITNWIREPRGIV